MTYVANGLRKTKTFAADNEFSFVCPIFNAATKIAACFKLRELVWEGREIEKRKGCQVCMQANKCPIDNITKRLGDDKYGDPYGSIEPKTGTLRKDDLERVLKVMVPSSFMERAALTPRERELIETANERIVKAIGSSRAIVNEDIDDDFEEVEEIKPARKRGPPKPSASELAAQQGDISAAINATL